MLKRIPMTRREFVQEIYSQSSSLEELFDETESLPIEKVNDFAKARYISVKDLESIFSKVFIVSKKEV